MLRVQRYLIFAFLLCLVLGIVGVITIFHPSTFWDDPVPLGVYGGGIFFVLFGFGLPLFASRHHVRCLRAASSMPVEGWARFWKEEDSESTSYFADVAINSATNFAYRMSFFPLSKDLPQPFEGTHSVKVFLDPSSALPLVLECGGKKAFSMGNPVDLRRGKAVQQPNGADRFAAAHFSRWLAISRTRSGGKRSSLSQGSGG